ncbi:MAG: TetR family transcriptional regulator C-terminal domain-containing protein [Hyphomicrobium sp.]
MVERERPGSDVDEVLEDGAIEIRPASTNNEVKILAAAESVFAKYGFRGATTALIAAKAGVTKPNIYYYFRNKEALYRKLLQTILLVWADSLRVIEAEKSPEECFRLYLQRKMEFSRSKPQLSRIFANEVISGAPYIRDQINRATRPLLEQKAAVIQGWIDEGKVVPVEPVYLIFMMWASTQAYADFGAQMQILLGKRQLDEADFSAALETITKVVLGGVLIGRAAPASGKSGHKPKAK